MRLETDGERRVGLRGSGWPKRRVVREGVWWGNATIKWVQLSCGHVVFRRRRPGLGATLVCVACARGEAMMEIAV